MFSRRAAGEVVSGSAGERAYLRAMAHDRQDRIHSGRTALQSVVI
jgi:hypothetical protein